MSIASVASPPHAAVALGAGGLLSSRRRRPIASRRAASRRPAASADSRRACYPRTGSRRSRAGPRNPARPCETCEPNADRRPSCPAYWRPDSGRCGNSRTRGSRARPSSLPCAGLRRGIAPWPRSPGRPCTTPPPSGRGRGSSAPHEPLASSRRTFSNGFRIFRRGAGLPA